MSTAEGESKDTLLKILDSLSNRQSFKMEAGAGAGKTHSLIDTLQHILRNRPEYLPRNGQRVACITYTNVARHEIIRRTDGSPYILADTIHGFLWELISPFRKTLLEEIPSLPSWGGILDGETSLAGYSISYDLGFRRIGEQVVSLHHDDIPALAIRLFSNKKFRNLVSDRFPIILVDEYQDTPSGLAEAMLGEHSAESAKMTYGFFGDHWQQIYDKTCGSIDHLPLERIKKRANWRSSQAVVSFLNSMRPELPQAPVSDAKTGSVTIYHTNNWSGPRGTHSKKGQIPDEVIKETRQWIVEEAQNRHHGSGARPHPKTLMLTHSSIAAELGFGNIDRSFGRNEDFVRKNDDVVSFLLDVIEPCCDFFSNKQYGPMFDLLKRSRPRMKRRSDKTAWMDLFGSINNARATGTVGDVLNILFEQEYFSVPQAVTSRHRKWKLALRELDDKQQLSEPRRLVEYGNFRDVHYREVVALREYVEENTPFSTQHGVKGAEYPDVLAVFGGGWTQYNFAEMLANFHRRDRLNERDRRRFERSRNLFYVSCSRARNDLILLFTTELPQSALETLQEWVGGSNIIGVQFSAEGAPVNP
ncbi:UvrD-helicase domain-containing protein [Streptomyces demainii]|uniref:DNA helicase-2/ATP-dependent DNA helicase PcrA n=1 Tax=Streptomyces demainii TaxID=588122 RepID=A0ABT9KL42_9ACTN|nr:UvrD-helicase domain-containing protein [Streptomyces demainii]MDP9609109.1 DNA helicase-2/ATP-dependent DNA helicase PcrA [Streptomyces demainii]